MQRSAPWFVACRFKAALLFLLPHHLLSRVVQWSSRCRHLPFLRFVIRRFVYRYDVDMSEALQPDLAFYRDFNSFFVRALRPEARPVVHEAGQICCPNDGVVSQLGDIQGEQVFQAKRHVFSLVDLLGGWQERAKPFIEGKFATMYLSPGDYHRVHMPLSGRLTEMVYMPGRLFSVSPDYAEAVPRLYARNERVACIFRTEAGPMAVVLVGAIFVGSIETVWAGEITPPRSNRLEVTSYRADDCVIRLERGEELGRFNMGGSTVIVLFGPGRVKWQAGLVAEARVQFGQALGSVLGEEAQR